MYIFIGCVYTVCRAWKEELDRAMATEGKVWIEKKRFNSFAPPRQNCTAKWYVYYNVRTPYNILVARNFRGVKLSRMDHQLTFCDIVFED